MQVNAEHLWASLELVATQQAKQLQNLRAGRLWTMLACRLPRRPGICPTRHLQALGCSPRACCYCKFLHDGSFWQTLSECSLLARLRSASAAGPSYCSWQTSGPSVTMSLC